MVHRELLKKILAFSITISLIVLIFLVLTPPSITAVYLDPGTPSPTSGYTGTTIIFTNVNLTIRELEALPISNLAFSIRNSTDNSEVAYVTFSIQGTELSDPSGKFTVTNITDTSNLPYQESGDYYGYDEEAQTNYSFGYGYGPDSNDLTILYRIRYTTSTIGTFYGQLYVNTTSHTYASGESTAFTVSTPPDDIDAPIITNITATPSSQLINGYINITATITDNINLLEQKVRITGPAGYTPANISMMQDGGNTFYYNNTYTNMGIYTYSIWAKDTNNNSVASTTYQFDIFAQLNITTLLFRWNFVSLPFNQTISKANLIIIYEGTEYNWTEAKNAGIIIDTIYQWNRSSPQHYWSTSTLTPGYGYWIFAYHNCTIWATDLNLIENTNYITNLSIKWNIFGVPINQPVIRAY